MSGLRWPAFSLIVPRVAMFTTDGEVRLTIGASEGIGESATGLAGSAAKLMGAARTAAAIEAAARVSRKFMRGPYE
jgi:short-subunit dehydrogenase